MDPKTRQEAEQAFEKYFKQTGLELDTDSLVAACAECSKRSDIEDEMRAHFEKKYGNPTTH